MRAMRSYCFMIFLFYIIGIIPFILLLVLNIAVYRKISELQRLADAYGGLAQQKRQEIRLCQISIAIVAG